MHRIQISPAAIDPPPAVSRDQLLVFYHDLHARPSTVVVLVHGLFGCRSGKNSTWRGLIRELVGIAPPLDIALHDYKTGFARWRIWAPVGVETDAAVLVTHLQQLATQYESVIVVAHSLGGLVVLQALLDLQLKDKVALRRIVGLFAFAVPFFGSTKVPWWTKLISSDARALMIHSPTVTRLSREFSARFKLKLTPRLSQHNHIPAFAFVAVEDQWVKEISARGPIPNEQCASFSKHHNSICKPAAAGEALVVELTSRLGQIRQLLLHPTVKAGSSDYLVREAEPTDGADIVALGNQAFGAQAVGDQYLTQWLEKNPTCLYVLQKKGNDGKIAGYWCILAIAAETYDGLIDGTVSAAQLDAHRVLSLEQENGHYYVGGVVAVGTKARAQAIAGFEQFIRNKADIHARRSQTPINVLVRAATNDGLRMISRNAFKHVAGVTGLGGLYAREFFGRPARPDTAMADMTKGASLYP
jgi:hypothetical protein